MKPWCAYCSGELRDLMGDEVMLLRALGEPPGLRMVCASCGVQWKFRAGCDREQEIEGVARKLAGQKLGEL